MSLTEDTEPFEYSILDELISNLTLSDEESLGLCKYLHSPFSFAFTVVTNGPLAVRDDEADDDYWTAEEDGSSTPPRLRTSSLRRSNGTFFESMAPLQSDSQLL